MHWKKGLFRVWVVTSIVWIISVSALTSPWKILFEEDVDFSVPDFPYPLVFRTDTTEDEFRDSVMSILNKRSTNFDANLETAQKLIGDFRKDQLRVRDFRTRESAGSLLIAILPPVGLIVLMYALIWVRNGFIPD